ncbi:carboxymuconolactone decarboxylase family protein [Geodermatophilus sp. SYSU D01176]
MAHSPVVLNACAALQRVIAEDGTLDAATREAIALVVGTSTGAPPASPPTLGAQAAGPTTEQTLAIRSGSYRDDPELAALLTLVRESAGAVGPVGDRSWQAALDAGWSDTELTEASVHIALNLFTNHVNHPVQTELDLPAAPAIRSGRPGRPPEMPRASSGGRPGTTPSRIRPAQDA